MTHYRISIEFKNNFNIFIDKCDIYQNMKYIDNSYIDISHRNSIRYSI
jgi:hypothetical protein